MSELSIVEFKNELESRDYKITEDELRELVSRLTGVDEERFIKMKHRDKAVYILNKLRSELLCNYSDTSLLDHDDDNPPILDIYLEFCGLQFQVNEYLQLVLTEEMYYNRGCSTQSHEIVLGEPTRENVEKVIKLFKTKGKGNSKLNSDLGILLREEKMI